MKRLIQTICAGLIALAAMTGAAFAEKIAIQLKDGVVEIQLNENAKNHAERIVTLAKKGFYNGIVFHRVIDGFMAQTGDPTGTGMGASDLPNLKAEFSNDKRFTRGTVGMARAQDPDSANSQFFIMLADGDFLNGKYTIIGEVVNGMEYVDNIKKGDRARNGQVDNPDKMISVKVIN